MNRVHVLPFLMMSLIALTGCPKLGGSSADAGATTTAATPTDSAAAKEAPPAPPTPAGVAPAWLKVTPPPSGPIVVKGYPHDVKNGMNDPAKWAGWSKDGNIFGYCSEGGGIQSARCEFYDRTGKNVKSMKSMEGDGSPAEKAKRKAIDDYLKEKAIPTLVGDKPPPALTGTWKFADITIEVARDSDVKVGGTVKGETKPVFPVSLVSPNASKANPPGFAAMNMFASNGTEFGMLGTFFAGEYSDVFATKVMSEAAFASLVYNDTGFRYHQKNDFKNSSDLFARAVAADPNAKLPAYNLACAYARLKDPKTKDALAFAIQRDPTVKTRAPKDKDFEAVKGEAWFAEATK